MSQIDILLVDDSEIDRYIFERDILSVFSVELAECEDGEQALDLILDLVSKDAPLPKVIVLDINMPRMNGFDFLDAVGKANDPALEHLNVFMHSSSDLKEDVDKAMSFPCVKGYLLKGNTQKDTLKSELVQYLSA